MPTLQSIRFNRSMFTLKQAKAWLTKHKKEPIKTVDTSPNEFRFRMAPVPRTKKEYYRVSVDNGVSFIYYR